MERLNRKFESIRSASLRPVVDIHPAARIGLVYAGTSRYAVEESRDQIRKERGVETSSLRLRSYPFTRELVDFIKRHDRVYVVDQNRDAQMLGLMRLEFDPGDIEKLRSVRYFGGLPLDARTVSDEIVRQEGL
jgi:2-oxoglutarate ferredoxin oxidoreductase subunit alpha